MNHGTLMTYALGGRDENFILKYVIYNSKNIKILVSNSIKYAQLKILRMKNMTRQKEKKNKR